MLPICVKKPMLAIKPLALVAVIAAGLAIAGPSVANTSSTDKGKTVIELSNPATAGVVTVSDYEFNTFVLSEPAARVLFPAGSPVAGQPITLANGTQVLIQFAKGADRPIQMVFELESGRVETIRVQPKAISGITHPVGGARMAARGGAIPRSGAAMGYSPSESSPRGADVELLKTLTTSGMPPSEFSPVTLPAPTRFDKFSVVPLAGWTDGERQVYVFSLVAQKGQTAVVSPNQFYRQGISAILLDGDTVDAVHTPQLWVVEELSHE